VNRQPLRKNEKEWKFLNTSVTKMVSQITRTQRDGETMKKLFSVAVVAALMLAVSAKRTIAASSGVGVIDLDKIATTMGWIEDMQKNMQTFDTDLKNQLNTLLQGALKNIEDAKKQVAAEAKLTEAQTANLNTIKDPKELEALPLTKEQREKLVATVTKSNQDWQTALNNYQQAMRTKQQQLIVGYRDKIRPSARRVAAARGFSVVLVASDAVFYDDPTQCDVTDAVIDDLQKTYPKTTTPGPAPVAPATTAPAK
jgi:Skp family chaperone for outer membrane proteins